MSITSPLDSQPDDQMAVSIRHSVSKNVAQGRAVQVNGHVADNVYNFNFKNLVVNLEGLSLMRQTPQRSARVPSTIAVSQGSFQRIEFIESLLEPLRKAPLRQIDAIQPVQRKVGTLSGVLSGRYLKYHCESIGKDHLIRVTHCASNIDHFISGRIVRRLGLDMQNDPQTEKVVIRSQKRLPPTSSFVDLNYGTGAGSVCMIYRFYVVEDCKFDILLGARISNSRAASCPEDKTETWPPRPDHG